MIKSIIITVCLSLFISACGRKDDVVAIRKVIEKGAKLAEEKQVGDLMDLTAEGFVAMPGRHAAREVKGILFGAFMHYGRFKIHYPQPAVEVSADGQGASATVYFLIVRQNQTVPGLKELYDDPRRWLETVGRKTDLYQLRLEFGNSDDNWLVRRARLEGFKGQGFETR